ncbi:hypothetical protein J437_LFUL008892 [Ladona fulva]|uniref:Uncharacterized protein n=1 Tax=Ladona fulva TaxID=123851 RepID=A0A8K0KD98_LADFU|nr:hypothetical protein J437_LFUL008892 [Ladona fulva]
MAIELGNCKGFTVSRERMLIKRGLNSLIGVVLLIGFYTRKRKHASECLANHQGSVGKMEVDSIQEIIKRLENLRGVKYIN